MLTNHLIHSLFASHEEPFIRVCLGYSASARGAFSATFLILSGGEILNAIHAIKDLIRYAARWLFLFVLNTIILKLLFKHCRLSV